MGFITTWVIFLLSALVATVVLIWVYIDAKLGEMITLWAFSFVSAFIVLVVIYMNIFPQD